MDASLKLSQLDQSLFTSLEGWSEALKTQGVHKEITSRESLQKLQGLSQEQRNQIASFAQAAADIINSFGTKERVLERNLLEKALSYFGLVADDSIWNVMDEDTVVEIYGPNMIQLYRSVNFYQYSSYSLLDLSAFEWFVLWDRPRAVTEKLMNVAHEVLTDFVPLRKLDLPIHILREIRDTGLTGNFVPRAVLHKPGFVASVRSHISSAPVGLICMSKGDVIAIGDETLKIGCC